ncbi:hypothetical protein AAHC03_01078 [Spirometra sp. Aus1]|nr:unnamed protein product [Spirometra erinaceieuropaei]
MKENYLLQRPVLGMPARLCCATKEAPSQVHGVQTMKSDCVADVIPWRHDFKPNSKFLQADGRTMRFFSDYKHNNAASNCNDDVGKRCFKAPGKKKLSDSGYTDSSYNKTNVGKRAECGSMFALLSHKYQYEWIEQMQGKLEAQHAEKYQKEQLRKCKPTDTHASYLRSMKQMDKSATLREMARKDYEAVARINSQYYCPCRQPVCSQPDSGACP